jgi:hypothetical protein
MNNKMSDSQLNELFQNDELHCSPDPAVKSRLDYTFMLKESQGKIRQNSFTGMFSWMFSWMFSVKNIPVAATLFVAVLLFSVFNSQQKAGKFIVPGTDTASIHIMPLNIDSIIDQSLADDTVVSRDLSSVKDVFPDVITATSIQPAQINILCKITLPFNEITFDIKNGYFRKTVSKEPILHQSYKMNYTGNRIA